MTLQILLISSEGRRPLSALINVLDWADYTANKEKYQSTAIMKIVANKGTTIRQLKEYGYNVIQVRKYNKERIAQREADRYKPTVKGNIII